MGWCFLDWGWRSTGSWGWTLNVLVGCDLWDDIVSNIFVSLHGIWVLLSLGGNVLIQAHFGRSVTSSRSSGLFYGVWQRFPKVALPVSISAEPCSRSGVKIQDSPGKHQYFMFPAFFWESITRVHNLQMITEDLLVWQERQQGKWAYRFEQFNPQCWVMFLFGVWVLRFFPNIHSYLNFFPSLAFNTTKEGFIMLLFWNFLLIVTVRSQW